MEQNSISAGEYNFPPPQYLVPPPAPYIPPGQFYAHLLHTHSQEPAPDAPEIAVPSACKRAGSPTQSPAPAKRGRGRPLGSKKKAPPAPRIKADAKAASQPVSKSKDAKENDPPAVYELSDSDSDIDRPEGGGKRWTVPERTGFYKFLLACDAQGDKRFEQHKTDPGHVYKRASSIVFKGSRGVAAIKGMWGRSIEIYAWIRAFEGFTGNGRGDADCDDPQAILKNKLVAARRSGLPLGSLKPATITQWEDEGWYELFNDRLGTSAKVSCTGVCHLRYRR